jgi:hypothetical protein
VTAGAREGDVFGVTSQNPFSDLHEVIQAPCLLHCGDSRNHSHDDKDDIERNVARFQAEHNTQNKHSETAGISYPDTAEPRSEPNKE